jgi:type IV secretion system protein VirB9
MKVKKTLLAVGFASIAVASVTNAFAVDTPLKLSTDQRIEVVDYSPYNVVPVHGSTFTTTQIIFSKNEYIENVQNGDLGAWSASISKTIPNMMFVKPTVFGSNTNMTVVTNKHTYYFHLTSNEQGKSNQKTATYAIKFLYPGEQRAKVERAILIREKQKQAEISAFQNPGNYNWDYSFNGDKDIMPLHVFDDGKFTYLQLQPNQAVPAVFAVNGKSGQESIVNYRQDGQYIVIQRTAPQFTLRAGRGEVASVFNNKAIAKLTPHHWL